LVAAASAAVWWLNRPPAQTILSFRIGATFEEVTKNSSYPVATRSNRPADDPSETKFGATWITEPEVTIIFDDPLHGFKLPPTGFGALTYMHNRATTLATSPMVEKVSFDAALTILTDLQRQFRAGGWEPWETNDSMWFDLTLIGKKRLYQKMFEPGYASTTTLRIPNKYGMTFRLKCVEGCWTREPPYFFLIDIGVSDDVFGRSQTGQVQQRIDKVRHGGAMIVAGEKFS
jgi:hypothetical protein